MRFLLGSLSHAPTSPASGGVASRMSVSVATSRSANRTPAIAAARGVRSERLICSSPSIGFIRPRLVEFHTSHANHATTAAHARLPPAASRTSVGRYERTRDHPRVDSSEVPWLTFLLLASL